MKRIYLCLCVLALALCLRSACAEFEGYTFVVESDNIKLWANTDTGEIIIEDARDGYIWRSNPAQPDSGAKGVHKMTLQSQIIIGFSSERGTALSAVSITDSAKRGGLSVTIENGEVIAVYDFPKQEISITVRYKLVNGCLEATIPVEQTRSYGLNTLTSVQLLPAFGAGSVDETGYLFVPDGSGAIIRFNNGVTALNEYAAHVYGKDPSVNGQVSLTESNPLARTYEQTVRLPVFGVNKGAHALFAVITQNDAKAVLRARVSNLTSYNYVYSEFELRSSGSMIMNRKEFAQTVAGVAEREGLTTGDYTVRYYFLSGEADSSLAGMARTYRQYLVDEKGLTARAARDTYPMYVDLYGYVDRTAHFLGIPYVKPTPLTTIGDIEAVTDALGVDDIVVRYRQFLSGTAYGAIASQAKPQKQLGDAKALKRLARKLAEKGGALYPDADLINVYKTGRGFTALLDAVLTPANSPQMQYQINYGNSKLDMTIKPWYLLSPLKYAEFYDRYLDDYAKLDLGAVSLSSIGDILTSDNRKNGVGRQSAQKLASDVLARAADIGDVMTDGGNAYAAALSTHIIMSPARSSDWILFDETVPFWQMVFHGCAYYSLSPANHAGDMNDMLLKCLEYGASPLFSFVGRNVDELMDSRMLFLFSADYKAWADTARAQYLTLAQVLRQVSDTPITDYQILSEHVRLTVYGNTRVYVNYAYADIEIDGAQVPARGFIVREGV